jgi:hypothetical protein
LKAHFFLEELKSYRVSNCFGVLALDLELFDLSEHVVALVDEVEEEMSLKPVLETVVFEAGVIVKAGKEKTDAATGSHRLL